jgi:hypothetical protein
VDTELSCVFQLFFVLKGAEITECGVHAHAIVPALNEFEHRCPCVRSRSPARVRDQFHLKGREETLRHCIVPAIALPAHARLHTVRLRLTVPSDRQFVALEDLLPAGLEAVDLSLRTAGTLGPLTSRNAADESAVLRMRAGMTGENRYGAFDSGWWSPWEHKELRDDRVIWFARMLWTGTYDVSYLARATTVGVFVKPPAHAEEMYNPGLQGRSDGGRFVVRAQFRTTVRSRINPLFTSPACRYTTPPLPNPAIDLPTGSRTRCTRPLVGFTTS